MKLKNIGNKIVSVGEVVILPGETKEVSGYDETPHWNTSFVRAT